LGDFTEYSAIRRRLTEVERETLTGETGARAAKERRQRELASLRKRLRAHPCHNCPERESHARWAQRWWKLRRETDALTKQITT
ncbi:hypothetical protein, partial [Pseudomonas sp. RTS4]